MKNENKRRRPKANYLCQLRIANYGIDASFCGDDCGFEHFFFR